MREKMKWLSIVTALAGVEGLGDDGYDSG